MSTLRSDVPPQQSRRMTMEEYFRLDAEAEVKSDYVGGEVIAMAGGSPRHSLVTANVGGEIRNALRGKPCNVYDSNLRIGIPDTSFTHYPDASVVCGDLQYDPRDLGENTVVNPILIVEVLSPSTMGNDRGEKFDHYLKLASLREYVLVFQDRPEVQTFYRRDDGTWLLNVTTGGRARIRLQSIGAELDAAEIYRGVVFDPPAAVPGEGEVAAADNAAAKS